jgi:hypothetical protein
VSVSTACCSGNHFTAVTSSVTLRRLAGGTHPTELHDLQFAILGVQHRAEKSLDGNVIPSLFHHLAPGAGPRIFTRLELAWQHPGLVLSGLLMDLQLLSNQADRLSP